MKPNIAEKKKKKRLASSAEGLTTTSYQPGTDSRKLEAPADPDLRFFFGAHFHLLLEVSSENFHGVHHLLGIKIGIPTRSAREVREPVLL